MTNEPKDNPDKVGYKTARDMLVDCANNTYCLTEELAEEYCDVILAEGERREREKERPKDVYSEGLTVGMGLGRQQALKEVEEQIEYFIGEWLKECPNDRRNGALSGAKKLKQAIDQLLKEEK